MPDTAVRTTTPSSEMIMISSSSATIFIAASRPFFSASCFTSSSSSMPSTPKAWEATITSAPSSWSFWISRSTLAALISLFFRKVWQVSIFRPVPRSMSPILDCFLASQPSRPPPAMPRMPTLATSPSSRALVAWVVEWAMKTTSSGAMLFLVRQFSKHSMTPAATPSSWSWVVITMASPTISWVSLSRATALVWVPPTSMPTRMLLLLIDSFLLHCMR